MLVTFNRADLLRQSTLSLLDQTYQDFDLLISDDASTDHTAEVAHELASTDPRIRVRVSEKNLGMPGNLNAALKEADSPLVAILHDGDLFTPTLLDRWVSAMDNCPEAAFAFNAYRAVRPGGETVEVYREDLPRCFPGTDLIRMTLARRGFGSPVRGTVIARRTALVEAGFFDPRFGFWADVDMWLRLSESHAVAYVDEPLILLPTGSHLGSQGRVPSPSRGRHTVQRIFWEARRRRASKRSFPLSLAGEAAAHALAVAASEGRHALLAARRALRRQ